ncbi:Signal peptide peptidase SppA, 36K type [uncultured delta proteobacterium]|uniref:Signal peptide peptidase SppA, 36K type n=1 Tax=uncultured delta proteobacterium TaxID=34034 RepID=A0A212K0K8_9DELT|nr:Signal peptide peptidase SppA, 36K type [uncultured delta proteobacterium]
MNQYPYAKQPFRKRRPKLFFVLLSILVLILVWACLAAWRVLDEKGTFSGPRLGLVTVEGFIGDGERTIAWIEKLRKNPSVAGVLVRINSPGGAVGPSQEIHMAVKRLAGVKPVVVSMGPIATSGGYYIAVAGKEIFAGPSTLTGSIGVRLQVTTVQNLMERIGVSSESLTTGKYKASGSPFKELTAEERAYLQTLLDDMQDQFVEAVATGRNLSKDAVTALADGRSLTGRQALEAKLVDRLGDREAAVARLAGLCNIEGEPTILAEPEKPRPWWQRLLQAAVDLSVEQSAEPARYQFVY